MPNASVDSPLHVFATCPPSNRANPRDYLTQAVTVARWSEEHGCTGILVYSDNSQLDPWIVAHAIVSGTRSISPLVAVQPVYMHPYTVAKMVATLGACHQRRVYLNMVAGGFKNDLTALNDPTPHDRRYERLVEYVQIVTRLLETSGPVSFEGAFYRVDKLTLAPSVPPAHRPVVFVSGSSDAGLAAARALGATAIKYPRQAEAEDSDTDLDLPCGIRVGIIARPREQDAWDIAHERFPPTRTGQLTRQLATKVSDSVWHQQLSGLASRDTDSPYWLVPFENYQTMCPYLVGSYRQVSAEVGKYLALGYRTIILDVPASAEDLGHTCAALRAATKAVA
jgi:alkanesulfonate monooxygenase